jgi:hypothetical protein
VLDIEKGRWLVEQQSGGILRQAGGQQNTLPFAAAQGSEDAMALRPATRPLHRLLNEPVILVRFEPAIRVRIPSHGHQLLCGERQIGVNGLWQVAHLLRDLAQRPKPLIASVDRDRSGLRPAKAGDDIEKRTFPSAIHSQEGEKFALRGAERGGVQDRSSAVGKADTFHLQRAAQLFSPCM